LSEQDQFILKFGCTFNSTFYIGMPQKLQWKRAAIRQLRLKDQD